MDQENFNLDDQNKLNLLKSRKREYLFPKRIQFNLLNSPSNDLIFHLTGTKADSQFSE